MADITVVKGTVGPQQAGDGDERGIRLGKSGDVITQPYGKYYELASRGQVYHAATAVAGVAPGTSVSTTAGFALYNPNGSGVNLVILKAKLGYVSGTLGAGVITWNANTNPAAAAVTGTAITVVTGLLGTGVGKGLPFTTATLPATPTITRVFASLTALLASTAVGVYVVEDDVDGAIIVAPGCCISLHATAAGGSSPLVVYSATWAERAV